MWGGNELDRTNTNFWNATFKGDIVYDPNFALNFHTVESQNFMKASCAKARDIEGVMID